MQFKAVIIDDEPNLREVIMIKVGKLDSDIKIVGEASNAKEGFELIRSAKPDIVFLDITMPNETGLEMLKRFDKIDFEVIFVTGHSNYGIDALKLDATDYLLKPIKTKDLYAAILKAKSKVENREKIRQYEELVLNKDAAAEKSTKIIIPGANYSDYVDSNDIIRCEGWQKYTRIYLKNNTAIVSSYNVGVFKEMLENYGFYDVHKSHIVNKKHIYRYLHEGVLVMSDGAEVPVSRRRRHDLMQELRVK